MHHGINEGHPVILPQEMAFHSCNTNQKAQNFFESGFIMQKSVTHLLVLEILYHLGTFKYWVIIIVMQIPYGHFLAVPFHQK